MVVPSVSCGPFVPLAGESFRLHIVVKGSGFGILIYCNVIGTHLESEGGKNGLVILIMAFLICPYGLPLLAAMLVGQLQRFRCWMLDMIYG